MLRWGDVITMLFFWDLFLWKILTSLLEWQALMAIPKLTQELGKVLLDYLC